MSLLLPTFGEKNCLYNTCFSHSLELGCLTDAGKSPEKTLHQPAFLETEIAERVAAKMTILAFVQQESESLEFKAKEWVFCITFLNVATWTSDVDTGL